MPVLSQNSVRALSLLSSINEKSFPCRLSMLVTRAHLINGEPRKVRARRSHDMTNWYRPLSSIKTNFADPASRRVTSCRVLVYFELNVCFGISPRPSGLWWTVVRLNGAGGFRPPKSNIDGFRKQVQARLAWTEQLFKTPSWDTTE